METFYNYIGEGHELNSTQMVLRAIIVFMIALVFLRLAGRRSFGMGSAFDNVTAILIGAVLSKAIIGAAPFFPTLAAAFTLAMLHRLFAFIALYSSIFGTLVKGEPRVLFTDGKIIRKNMKKSLITDKDLMEGVRKEGNTTTLDDVKIAYVERNGQISVIRKDNAPEHGYGI